MLWEKSTKKENLYKKISQKLSHTTGNQLKKMMPKGFIKLDSTYRKDL